MPIDRNLLACLSSLSTQSPSGASLRGAQDENTLIAGFGFLPVAPTVQEDRPLPLYSLYSAVQNRRGRQLL